MRTSISYFLLFSVLVLFSNCGSESRVKRLKLAHGLPIDHPVHQGMVFMGERLQEISGNSMALDIYPSEQLGSERQCLELLQIGSLSMTKVSAAVLENFAPKIRVLSLPYIFRSREHAYQVLDGEIGRRLLIQGEQYWLRGLTYFDAGMRSFYTKDRPVNVPEDLEGLKVRVQESKTAINLVRALGGAPTPISYGELYTALQQGVVDGAENNPPSFYTSRHYEVCKFYSLNEHTAVPDILLIGTVAWNNLDPQEQEWVQQAADEAKVKQRVLWAEAEAEALAAVQEAGVEVIRPDKAQFIEQTAVVLEEYLDDPSISGLIREIQAVE